MVQQKPCLGGHFGFHRAPSQSLYCPWESWDGWMSRFENYWKCSWEFIAHQSVSHIHTPLAVASPCGSVVPICRGRRQGHALQFCNPPVHLPCSRLPAAVLCFESGRVWFTRWDFTQHLEQPSSVFYGLMEPREFSKFGCFLFSKRILAFASVRKEGHLSCCTNGGLWV